jgi:late competence protein required for DNA uptake (superfamily II DNA/RNA helicase)
VAATLRSQSNTKAIRVEPISNIVKSLGAISCDSCEGKLASYDVYIDSGIANAFLKRYCSKCLQMIGQ